MKIKKELMVFENGEFGNVRAVSLNGKEYFFGIDIAKSLGYARPSKAISDHCTEILLWDTIKNKGGYPEKLIDENNVLELFSKCNTVSTTLKNKFLNWLQSNKLIDESIIILQTRREIEFIDLLLKFLAPFDFKCKTQFNILNYKIDLYIENINVVIEYDENGHLYYNAEQEKLRQLEIEKELQCTFIRVDSRDSDIWNCGYIMKTIIEKKLV